MGIGSPGGGGTHILTSSGWPCLHEPLLFSQAATRGHTNPGVLHSRARGRDLGLGAGGCCSGCQGPSALLILQVAPWMMLGRQSGPQAPGHSNVVHSHLGRSARTHAHTHSLSSSSRSSFSSFMRKLMEYTFPYRFFCIWNSLLGDSCRHSLQEGPLVLCGTLNPGGTLPPAGFVPEFQGLPSTDSVRPLPFPSSRRPGMTLSRRQAVAARPLLSGVAE